MVSDGTDAPWYVDAVREVGLRLQRRRVALGYSQEKVAHLAGVATYTYQKFEKGESKPGTPMNPTLFTLYALADALGMDVAELIQREDQAADCRDTRGPAQD